MGQTPLAPRLRAIVQYELQVGLTNEQIRKKHGVPESTIRRYRTSWEQTGEVYIETDNRGGRPHAISSEYEQILLLYFEQRPYAYLDEVAWFLFDEFDVNVDESTVWRTLKRLGWSRKAARFAAAQRNDVVRNWWKTMKLPQWNQNQLVFLDESAACERTGMLDDVSALH